MLDGIQKFHEFDAAVTRTHAPNHFAGGHVERGEQVERPMAELVVGTPLGLPRLERQERLRSLEGLHGRLLVDAEHHRIFGRIQVQADHIANLLDQLWVGGSSKTSVRCGCSPNARQMRLTADCVSPIFLAMLRVLQCVAPSGLLSSVATTTASTRSAPISRGRPTRGSS